MREQDFPLEKLPQDAAATLVDLIAYIAEQAASTTIKHHTMTVMDIKLVYEYKSVVDTYGRNTAARFLSCDKWSVWYIPFANRGREYRDYDFYINDREALIDDLVILVLGGKWMDKRKKAT